MLSTHSVRTTTTTLEPGQSWFSPSKSGKPITSASPTVVTVVTRVVRKPVQKPTPTAATPARPPASSSTSSATSSRPTSRESSVSEYGKPAPKKRKRIQDGSTTPKRPRVAVSATTSVPTKPRKQSKGKVEKAPYVGKAPLAIPPQLVYRQSRSRSVSAFEHSDARKTWTDEDGDVKDALITSEHVLKRLMHKYKGFFKNPNDSEDTSFEPHPENYPHVDLEYPNDHAVERFALLEPKDKDHYNPIMCLEQTLYTIVSNYLTPAQKALFGTLPEETLTAQTLHAAPNSTASTSSLSSLSSSSSSSLTAISSESPLSSPPSIQSSSSSHPRDLMRTLRRAIHLRDGPKFLSAMAIINELLRSLKNPVNADGSPGSNPLRQVPKCWSSTGIPQRVIQRVIEETYQRSVGPHIHQLKRYSAFSSQVYGELMPTFTSDIIKATGLHADSLLLDLGSGVGNVVLQCALQTGCRGFGVEIMDGPADCASRQLQQLKLRCRMWGVSVGEVELVQGDMTAHPRVDELMSKADVVLVNNFVFKEELNEAIRPRFLDLKEGAIVVSLKPFAPLSNQRLTERNIDDISAIFDVTSRPYHSGTVSWSSGSGQYYLHRVDREGYRDCRAQFERVQSALGRRGRSKKWPGN